MQKYIVGNWKMNGTLAEARDRAAAMVGNVPDRAKVILCVPSLHLPLVANIVASSSIAVGLQDCHTATSGAYTGSVSAAMGADAGAKYTLVGHSERRAACGETDAEVRLKAEAALVAGLTPIVCVGETLAERQSGQAEAIVTRQIEGSVPVGQVILAYEPVWAIGAGQSANPADIAQMHKLIHALKPDLPLLYGASVKPDNAAAILALENVDGVLVGGASLKSADFLEICRAA